MLKVAVLSSLIVGVLAYLQIALYLTPKSIIILVANMLLAAALLMCFYLASSLLMKILLSVGNVAILCLVSLPSFCEKKWCKIYNILEQSIISATFIYLAIRLSTALPGNEAQLLILLLISAFHVIWYGVNLHLRRNTFTLMPMPESSYPENIIVSLPIYIFLLFCALGGDAWLHWFLSDTICFSVFLAVVVLALESVVLLLFVYAKGALLQKQRLQEIKAQNVLNNQYVDDFTRFRKSVEIMEHDQKHLISTLQQLLNQGDTERAVRLLQDISGKISVENIRYFCDNHTINAVLLDATQRCKEMGVAFTAKIRLSTQILIDDAHMAALLMNITSNALECCQGLQDKQHASIEMAIYTKGDYFSVQCRNSIEKTPMIINGNIETTKEDNGLVHGLGLESIRLISKKYHGKMDLATENRVFKICVTMENIVSPPCADMS